MRTPADELDLPALCTCLRDPETMYHNGHELAAEAADRLEEAARALSNATNERVRIEDELRGEIDRLYNTEIKIVLQQRDGYKAAVEQLRAYAELLRAAAADYMRVCPADPDTTDAFLTATYALKEALDAAPEAKSLEISTQDRQMPGIYRDGFGNEKVVTCGDCDPPCKNPAVECHEHAQPDCGHQVNHSALPYKAMRKAFVRFIDNLPAGYPGPINPAGTWFDAFAAGAKWWHAAGNKPETSNG